MRPLSPRSARTLLLLLGAAFCALAVNASVLLPLWELPDEYSHWLVIRSWARTARPPDLGSLPPSALPAARQPPLAPLVFAAGAHALGIADTEFLARPDVDATRDAARQHLHGADEVFPFRGPARALHLLRLLNVLCGLVTVLGSYALARALLPGRPAVWAGAAALVAFQPAFISLCTGLGNEPLTIALGTVGLLRLATLASGGPVRARDLFATGLLLGLALLAGFSAAFLLPAVPLALLLRRPGGSGWRDSLGQADWILAGLVVIAGPFLAWSLATSADPFGWSTGAAVSADARGIPDGAAWAMGRAADLLRGWIAPLSGRVPAGLPIVMAWSCVLGGALLLALRWLPWQRLRARRAGRRARAGRDAQAAAAAAAVAHAPRTAPALDGADVAVAALLAAGTALSAATQGHPSPAALAGLLALAWCRLPPAVGLVVGAVLAALAFHDQVHVLGPACWPPQRLHDPHFMAFDPLARAGPEQRLSTLRWLAPPDGSRHERPPALRWPLPADNATRFTVHASIPGMLPALRSYEDDAVSVRDRFTLPAAWWYAAPPGVPLELQVLRLPTLDEALAAPDGAPDVTQSTLLTLRRLPGPAPPTADADAAAAAR